MTSNFSHTIVAMALALAAGLGTAGFAAGPAMAGEPRQSLVSPAGLDLETAAGQFALHQRLERAARRACDDGGYRDVKMQQAEAKCARQALADAHVQLAAATGIRMGTIGVPASPILH